MDRDMSYDLDAAFAGRNAGELVNARQTRTVVRRKPGLSVETPSDDPESLDPPEYQQLTDVATRYAPPEMAGIGAMSLDLDLPVIGRVNLLHLAAGIAAGVAISMLLRRRPTATNPRRRR